jgi:hypothetical protein
MATLTRRLPQTNRLCPTFGISLLRVLDMVLWMDGKGFQQPDRLDEEVGA